MVGPHNIPHTGGSLFPSPARCDPGATLLDYFAGQAMLDVMRTEQDRDVVARLSYDQAEAMIREKHRREGHGA